MTNLKSVTAKTVFGFTIREIVGAIVILFTVFLFWSNINIRIMEIETNIMDTQQDIIKLKQEIDINRNERLKQVEDLRKENREDHLELKKGQDKIMEYLLKNKR